MVCWPWFILYPLHQKIAFRAMRSSRGERFNSCIHAPKAIFQLPHAARVETEKCSKSGLLFPCHGCKGQQQSARIHTHFWNNSKLPSRWFSKHVPNSLSLTLIHAGWKYQFRSTPNLLADRQVSTSARKPGDYRIGQVFPRDQEDHLHTLVVAVSAFWTMTCFFCEFWTSRKNSATHLQFELYEFKFFGNLETEKAWRPLDVISSFSGVSC